MPKVLAAFTLGVLTVLSKAGDVAVCPGEGPRYGDYKCNHDRTHRVCAKLVDNPQDCNELSWDESGDSFWDITGRELSRDSLHQCFIKISPLL